MEHAYKVTFTMHLKEADLSLIGVPDTSRSGSGTNPIPVFYAIVGDECPTCSAGGLDFSNTTQFSGVWPLLWKLVDCPGKTSIE